MENLNRCILEIEPVGSFACSKCRRAAKRINSVSMRYASTLLKVILGPCYADYLLSRIKENLIFLLIYCNVVGMIRFEL